MDWAKLFKSNRASENRLFLSYIVPDLVEGKPMVKLDKAEVEKETKKWKIAFIVYVIGDLPGYNYMTKYVAKTWSTVAAPEIYYHEEGYYVVKFASLEDMHEVI